MITFKLRSIEIEALFDIFAQASYTHQALELLTNKFRKYNKIATGYITIRGSKYISRIEIDGNEKVWRCK